MMIYKVVLAGALAAVFSTVAAAQQDEPFEFDVVIETEDVEIEHEHAGEEAHASEHAHGDHDDHDDHAIVHSTAPVEASPTLENVTWELLSRLAAEVFSGNHAALLSGNEPEVLSGNQTNVASGNELEVLSGNHISLFSNIQIDIHITGVPNPAEMMGGRREIRIETRNVPQGEAPSPSFRRDPPRDTPRDQPRRDFRPEARDVEYDQPAESPRDE